MSTVNETLDDQGSNTVENQRTDSFEPLQNPFEEQLTAQPSLLPRQSWNSQLSYLKALLKAKQALDRVEKSLK